ncbi:MAG: UDP-N-acetylmuramoyl-L-alanyl-D-glutamate--2,6-diaminopimelate ligase [Gammaproteobacteria bacterium]
MNRAHSRCTRLSQLLAGLAMVDAASDREIGGVTADSRRLRPGDLFLACGGERRHGVDFIPQALAAGAAAVVYEDSGRPPAAAGDSEVPLIAVAVRPGLAGEIAARYYRYPATSLEVLGITGTNGKTSCCHFLAQALEADGGRCGVIGTLGYGPRGALQPASHTTPDGVTLQALLAEMRDAGLAQVVMEVSSHALAQGRVAAVAFDGALFTNLSHEHLDYHGDLESYARCKQQLFHSPGLRHAAVNADDPEGRRLLAALPRGVTAAAYGLGPQVQQCSASHFVQGELLRADSHGLRLRIVSSWGEGRLHSELLGRFNAGNLLGTLAMLLLMEIPLAQALRRLERVHAVPGRMERFGGGAGAPLVVVDYAHTPAALEAVLATLAELTAGSLWCVFGCGGERDQDKRPLMGRIAERHADQVIVTDDNPRHEDPAGIVRQILAGMERPAAAQVIRERGAAIAHAVRQAAPHDIVLVAGKGHETYQLVAERCIPFSDRQHVQSLLGEAA